MIEIVQGKAMLNLRYKKQKLGFADKQSPNTVEHLEKDLPNSFTGCCS